MLVRLWTNICRLKATSHISSRAWSSADNAIQSLTAGEVRALCKKRKDEILSE